MQADGTAGDHFDGHRQSNQTSPDPFDALKTLWGTMGFALPGMAAPSFDTNELDKRIAEMRAVAGWLEANLTLLQTTIQTLELQRNTLAEMQANLNTHNTPHA